MIDKIKGIGETYGLTVLTFGHAGDGNIHVNFMIDQQDKDEVSGAHKAVEDLFRATLDLGGTLSGEHGIGITKAPYLKYGNRFHWHRHYEKDQASLRSQ